LHDRYASLWATATHHHPLGTNVYDREWDVLIILDCCRVDAMRDVSPEYDFIDEVDSMLSVGSTSREWIAKTFTRDRFNQIAQTAYVSANLYPRTIFEWKRYEYPHREGEGEYRRAHMDIHGFNPVDKQDFAFLDQVWEYTPDEMIAAGKVLPEFVTDRAIDIARTQTPNRLIIHYMYPHDPYIARAVQNQRELFDFEQEPMLAFRTDEPGFETVYEAYLDELRFALDSVEVLLNNIDAETVAISADHGDGFGEWGIYSHQFGALSPHVKKVPWVETTATDSGEYEPTNERTTDTSQAYKERLEALGYK
jgi:hypothetical protein